MNYKELATIARRKVLTLIHKGQTSHIGSNLSVIDIATVINENLSPFDRIVWSKGWAAATIYYFLYKQGKITKEQLDSFPNPPFLGLAETSVPGVETCGGSMGHGLPVACGIALGLKLSNTPGRVFCILSDGEMDCGTTWESALFAAQHKLNNLMIFVDVNQWQAMGTTKDILNTEPLDKKFTAFNWRANRVDGHNHQALHTIINNHSSKPVAVICDTVKGKGVSFMENELFWHYGYINEGTYQKAMAEL